MAYLMPTVANYSGPDSDGYQSGMRAKISGTDQWNDLIYKVSSEYGLNPVFVKCIMATESGGNLGDISSAGAYGLMQVIKRSYNASQIDWNKILKDPEYAIRCGCDVIIGKVTAARSSKKPASVYNIAKYYMGWNSQGDRYAAHIVKFYTGFGYKDSDLVTDGVGITGSASVGAHNSNFSGDTNTMGTGLDFSTPAGYTGKTTMSLGDLEANDPNSSKFIGTSPEVEDDNYPAHRYADSPFVLRIGDSQFFIPPDSIKTTKVTMVDSRHNMRAKNPMMTKSGFTTNRLDIRMYFANTDMINGYPIDAPGGKKYYMDGLRSLLAQFFKNPFLPIRNELINNQHGIFNVALYNIAYSTDSEFPNLIVADMSFLECTMEPFTLFPDFIYDRLFNYPLWRWFYQQQLFDKESDRHSSTYLKPVPKNMNGKCYFKALDRDLVEKMQNDTIAAGGATGAYALSKLDVPDIRSLMTNWDIGGAILRSVTVGVVKRLTPLHIDGYEKPVFQDLGGVEKEFSLEFYCTDRLELESLQTLVSHLEEMARDYRFRFVSGFLAIDNELVNLAGIKTAMVLNMDTETIPGFDNNYIVRLYCKAFDPSQKNQERLEGFNYKMTEAASKFSKAESLLTKKNQLPGVVYDYLANEVINSMELYPDLELPTYEDANAAVADINAFRTGRGQSALPFTELKRQPGATWVETDFYFCYPTQKQAYNSIKFGEMGDKIMNVLMNGTYDEIAISRMKISTSATCLRKSCMAFKTIRGMQMTVENGK
jgi:hypothetical protein